MKTAWQMIDLSYASPGTSRAGRLVDFYEITKPRMNFLVVITTMVGYCLASPVGQIHWPRLFHTLLGTALTAAAASVLNQLIERRFDALMPRTRSRPIATGRIAPQEALLLGAALGIFGVA